MLQASPLGNQMPSLDLAMPLGAGPPPHPPVHGPSAPYGHPPPPMGGPVDIYSDLKHGIDKIQDANFHLNMQSLANEARKTDAERTLFSELRRRNEDLKDTSEDLKHD